MEIIERKLLLLILLIVQFFEVKINAQEIISDEVWVWNSAVQYKKGKTDSATFARLAQIKTGSLVELSELPKAERVLLRTAYFTKNSETKLYRIANRNRIIPAFDFADATSNFAEAMVSYDAETEEFNAFLSVQLMNIFGTARDFVFGGENSKNYRRAEISYKEPFILGLNGSLKLYGEFLEYDSTSQRNANLEYIQKFNFEWQYSVGGGYKNKNLYSFLSLGFDSRDKFPLPFKGLFTQFSSEFSEFIALNIIGEYYQPVSKNWTVLFASKGAGMLPSSKNYKKDDLFFIGGKDNFIGLAPRTIKTKSYGVSELDFQWHGLKKSALHLFIQNGIYRNNLPLKGWEHVLTYGSGWEQDISNTSIAIYYALVHKTKPVDGLLNLSVKIGF